MLGKLYKFMRLIRKVIYAILLISPIRILVFWLQDNFSTKSKALILMYHRVNDEVGKFVDLHGLRVKTSNFERQIKYLAANYRVISLKTLVEELKSGNITKDRQIVITFDDGYQDNYWKAYPVLKKYAVAATIFLTADYIEIEKEFWWDEVQRFVWDKRHEEIIVDFLSLEYRLETDENRLSAYRELYWKLRYMNLVDRERMLEIFRAQSGECQVNQKYKSLFLSWIQVLEMAQNDISFGAHTCLHPVLSQLALTEMKTEIVESKRIIESNLGEEIPFFAYPFGKKEDFNEKTKAVLKEAGFHCACSTIYGANKEGTDLFELKRIPVRNWDFITFVAEINRAFRR